MALQPAVDDAGSRPTPGALFVTFLLVSLMGFGGPIVWARRILVDRRRWLDDQEFAEIFSFCQFLPGPNVVSLSVCMGARFRGAAGALAALAGFMVIPWSVGFALGTVLLRYAHLAALQGALRGIAAVAAGMIIGTGIKLLRAYRGRPMALLFAMLAFGGLALAGLPLLVVVAVLVPASIAASRHPAVTA